MRRQAPAVLILTSACAIALTEPAYAYLDPGTGSMILQGMLGAVAAGLYVIKLRWSQLKAFFASRFSKETTAKGGE